MPRSLVIIPTYNEKENILKILDAVIGLHSEIDVLIVDDGSPDGTGQLVRATPLFNQRIFLIERSGKQGLGTAYITGFKWGCFVIMII